MAATTNVTNTNKRSLPTEMQNLAIGDSGTPPTSKKQKVRSVHNIHTETASKTTSDHEMASESKADDDKTVETLIGQLRLLSILSRSRFTPGTVSTRPSKDALIWNSLKRQAI